MIVLVWCRRPTTVMMIANWCEDGQGAGRGQGGNSRKVRPPLSLGTVIVSLGENPVPVGHVKFKLSVVAAETLQASSRPCPTGEVARRYTKAFTSYASHDRSEVMKRVQMLKGPGIEYFMDVLGLAPGERWQQALYQHIDESDLFLLFWSSAARDSQWVLKEVRYAMERKANNDFGLPEMIPVIIEGPPPVAPPEELKHLHFDDWLVYLTV